MKILVTGASGFIGRALIDALVEAGHSVDGTYSNRSSKLSTRSGDVICDLSDADSFKGCMQDIPKNHWDVVVHLASVLCNEASDDAAVFETNLNITRNIVELCRHVQPAQLIHTSSIAVYPNTTGVFSELSAVRPSVNAEAMYGLSKVCSENLFDHYLKGTNTRALHLRLAQVWGRGMRSDRIMSIMRDELENTGKITVFGNGERTSNFIHIDYLLSIMSQLIGREDISGVYNIGQESLSYLQLALRVAEEGGVGKEAINLVEKGSRARFILDTKKFDEMWTQITE